MVIKAFRLLVCCLLPIMLEASEQRDTIRERGDTKENKEFGRDREDGQRPSIPAGEWDNFSPKLFPNVRALRLTALRISLQRDAEESAHKELYQQLVNTLVPFYSVCIPPDAVTVVKPVLDARSYRVTVSPEYKNQIAIPMRLHTLDEQYHITIPLLNPSHQGDLSVRAPRSVREAYGRMAHLLADFTSYNVERRNILYERFCLPGYLVALFGTFGVVEYATYNQLESNTSSITTICWMIGAYKAHEFLIAPPLTYTVKAIMAHRLRRDQRLADKRAVMETPAIEDIHPLVSCLMRDYVSDQLSARISSLHSCRNRFSWLQCEPLRHLVYTLFQRPLQEASKASRIPPLLEISYTQLSRRLSEEGASYPASTAAQRVSALYGTMIENLYELNEEHIDEIIMRTKPVIELTHRTRTSLTKTMRDARRVLLTCLPSILKSSNSAYTQ